MQVISGAAETLPNNFYERVASYRHQVFVERLGWALHTENGMESDQFDRPDTIYVVSQDGQGEITGCARLLPTTGPYLLGEVFPQLLNGLPPPCSPDVWELSRFATGCRTGDSTPVGMTAGQLTRNLLAESVACASEHGAKKLITVTSLAQDLRATASLPPIHVWSEADRIGHRRSSTCRVGYYSIIAHPEKTLREDPCVLWGHAMLPMNDENGSELCFWI